MFGNVRFLVFLFWLQVSHGQIDTSQCGKSSCCFRFPDGCSNTDCDILISFQSNKTGVLDVSIGTRKIWVAFGLNGSPGKMDGTSGEICYKIAPSPLLKGFRNTGTSADFSLPGTGLVFKGNEVKNNFLVCRYSRPITSPSGSYMRDLNQNFYITAAFGTSLSGSQPMYHGSSRLSTTSSPSKLDFTKPCLIEGAQASQTKVIAHGCVMIVAWVCFAATGMFIARYTKPVTGEMKCFGQKVWFQSHRMLMACALLLTIIGFIIIFVHKGGWSQGVGAHPILGCIVSSLAVLQPIMAAFRPHPEEERRWMFNLAHRSVGVSTLILAGVTILLGLDLFQTDKVVIIVWFAVCVAFIIIMEIGLMVIAKYNFSGEFDPVQNSTHLNIDTNSTNLLFRKVTFFLATVTFFGLGFATVGLVATKAS